MSEQFSISKVDPSIVAAESKRAIALLATAIPEAYIHEVGSTAVPDLVGKQDIDILVRVPVSEFTRYRNVLDDLLVRNTNQLSNEVYQGYLVESHLDVAVQLTVIDGPNDNFLRFLERLRSQPGLVAEYNALKYRFDGRDMTLYREAKHAFIQRVLG